METLSKLSNVSPTEWITFIFSVIVLLYAIRLISSIQKTRTLTKAVETSKPGGNVERSWELKNRHLFNLTNKQKKKLFISWGLYPFPIYSDTLKKRFAVYAINRFTAKKKIERMLAGEKPYTVIEIEISEFNLIANRPAKMEVVKDIPEGVQLSEVKSKT